MIRIVADVGNSRLKLGWARDDGMLVETVALDLNVTDMWRTTLDAWRRAGQPVSCLVASVNPPVATMLAEMLREEYQATVRLLGSASDVPLRHRLGTPGTTGADRALAVREAVLRRPGGAAGQVVCCGSAVTVERIAPGGDWEGGAIAPGLGLSARALNQFTAQLPLAPPGATAPPSFGGSTRPALAAGVFWGCVGAVRELLRRQAEDFPAPPWRIWTGGDAATLAPWVDGPNAVVCPNLILEGLARLAIEGARSP